jgi:hypothetical protein
MVAIAMSAVGALGLLAILFDGLIRHIYRRGYRDGMRAGIERYGESLRKTGWLRA